MTQADRDRMVTWKKAKRKIITQAEAAAELQVSVRHVKRMLRALGERGDRAVGMGCVDGSRTGRLTRRSGTRR
jgi:predicted DNA-binding transcriptional regulator YafY